AKPSTRRCGSGSTAVTTASRSPPTTSRDPAPWRPGPTRRPGRPVPPDTPMRPALLAIALTSLTLAGGCAAGPKLIMVKGKVTNGGKSIVPNKQCGVTMVFIPVPETGRRYPAGFNVEDDTYEVQGPDGKGVPPGKYQVTLNIMSIAPTPATDKINEQFAEGKTPIE